MNDSTIQSVALSSSIKTYHQFLFPETALYDGSEYPFNVYYSSPLSQGNPFFYSTSFDSGSISYQGMIYQKVPLLYDVIKDELLTNDPSGLYIIRLDKDKVDSFDLWGNHFIHVRGEGKAYVGLTPGFYEVLYSGPTAVYKIVIKKIKENGASSVGLNTYASNADIYFMKKGGVFYRVRSRKSIFSVFSDKKKGIQQIMRKNHLKLKKEMDGALLSIAHWLDGISD
ncbi:MAG: hypothetical protein KGM98_12385 [Bacteroidota bacterium]|nr:hypothetical protein [Bacteroidota bacterium]